MKSLIFVLALIAVATMAQDSRSATIVLDGDTLLMEPEDGGDPVKVRLWGVDAPEMKVWPWGPRARRALESILPPDKDIRCKKKGMSRGRIVAQCFYLDSGKDIGALMIRTGFAVEHRAYSKGAYAEDEREARRNGVGVWGTR